MILQNEKYNEKNNLENSIHSLKEKNYQNIKKKMRKNVITQLCLQMSQLHLPSLVIEHDLLILIHSELIDLIMQILHFVTLVQLSIIILFWYIYF